MPHDHTPRLHRPRAPWLGPLLAGLALSSSAAALAQASPYYIGATLGYAHDSNIFRTPKERAQGDSYTSVGLVAGLDQPIGRQRLYANGNVRNNRYNEIDNDNVSYGLNAGLDWSSIERLSGNLNLSLSQNLASYSDFNSGEPITVKNLERNRLLSARVQWGMVSLLTLEGTLAHRETSYSNAIASPYDIEQNTIGIGLKYRPSGALTLGTGVRYTRGSQPNKDFDRQDLDFTANWVATGQSTLNARISLTRQDFETGATARDFSGATGLIGWSYRPTGKLWFNTQLSRDTGTETGFFNETVGVDNTPYGDDSRYTTALLVNANYEVSSKIRLTAAGRYARRSLFNSVRGNGNDATKSLSLGVSYEPARSWLLSCNVARNTRGASREAVAAGLTYRYGSDSYGCTAQFTIR